MLTTRDTQKIPLDELRRLLAEMQRDEHARLTVRDFASDAVAAKERQ